MCNFFLSFSDNGPAFLLILFKPVFLIHLTNQLIKNNIMRRRSTLDKLKSTETSVLVLPKATLKTKLEGASGRSSERLKSLSRSLNESTVSLPANNFNARARGKEPKSFYNDRSGIYVSRSRLLSEKNVGFRNRNLSFSERKRYESTRT